jgi:DNA-binding response OmpR family regulator
LGVPVLSANNRADFNDSDCSVNTEDSDQAHVLVVEDDVPLMNALCAFARKEGYTATGATNGRVALDEIEAHRPDIIILDLLLPIMDGYEVMERLTAQYGRGRPRVVVLSATDRLELAQARIGADAYIAKPFDPERLRAALQRVAVPTRRKKG